MPAAEPYLRAAAETDSTPGAPLKLALADYYVSMNRKDAASTLLNELAKRPASRSAARTRLAVLAYDRKNRDEAHRQIDAVLERDPRHAPAVLVKARFLLAEGKTDEALKQARAAVGLEPSSVQAHYLLGSIHRLRGDVDLAMVAFNDVLRLNPRVVAAQVELARLNLAAGRADAAVQLAEDAAREQPGDADVQLTLARSLLATGQSRRAEPIVRTLAARVPDSALVLSTLGMLQAQTRDSAGARQSFERALRLDPANMEAAVGLASLDLAEKRHDSARARADAIVERLPKSAPAHVFAARVYWATGDSTRPESLLRTAIDLDPDSLEAYGLLGKLYALQKRLDAARQTFEAIATERPDAVSAHTVVALIDEMQGRQSEARKRYERIVQIAPSAVVACNNLAYMYAEHGGSLEVALQLAQRARQKAPDAPEILDTVGWVYYRKGLPHLAVPLFQEAVVKAPSSPTYRYHLALAYRESGDMRKAREAFTQVVSVGPESPEAGEARKALQTM
jgi:tetratricopeptide (TPR) repeat protein